MAYIPDRAEGCIDIANRSLRVTIVAGGGGGGSVNYADAEVPTGTIDGINDTFTLANSPSPAGSLQAFMNGLLQTEGVDYVLTGASITYASPPEVGDTHIYWYRF